MATVIDNPLTLDSLQREPDIKSLPALPMDKWPSYMLNNVAVDQNEYRNIVALKNYFDRSVATGYFQSHPYDQMFTGLDSKVDELTLDNNYMRIIFGGEPDPGRDNIDLAYNNAIRQMAEAPVSKDSLIGHQNPLEFVQGEEATKDSLLRTFDEQRRFYKGTVDTDAERFLKTRPTHKLIATTFYGKNITQSGTSVRYNHVRGQADLINRPMHLTKFRPIENLSSKTYAPNGDGGEVPLNYENTNGLDPRAVNITDEPRYDVGAIPEQYNFNTVGGYPGREVDSYMFDFAEQNPTFSSLFYQFKPRM